MARTTKTSKTTTGKRGPGRPSNAEIARRNAVAHHNLVELVSAAAAAAATGAIQAALGDGTVTTMGIAQPVRSVPQSASTSAPAASAPAKKTTARKAPGRPINPDSNRSKARQMYLDLNSTMKRADIVNKMVTDLGLSKGVANTYYHEAEKGAGNGKRRQTRRAAPAQAAAA